MAEVDSWKYKLGTLDKRIKAFAEGYRQNIALLGDDDQEISYLLNNYLSVRRVDSLIYIHVTTAYIDRKNFLKSITISLLGEYVGIHDTFDALLNHTQALLPLTVAAIKETFRRSSPPTFLEILEIINKFINESGRKCVFIIEDFLGLKKLFPNFHHDFSKFIILQRNCMVILAAMNIKESQTTLYSDLNLLFGSFEKILLSETDPVEAYAILREHLLGLNCSPFFVSFFFNILGANTMYYQLMKDVIRDSYCADDEVRAITVAIKKLLYNNESYFFQRFIAHIRLIEATCKSSGILPRFLVAMSEGYLREKELLSLHFMEAKDLRIKLQKLSDMNYVESLGTLYRLKDPLFSFWLSHVFAVSFLPPVMDAKKREILFQKKLYESIVLFKTQFNQDNVSKIIDLLSSFKNDTVRIGKDKYRLPLIEKSRVLSYPEKDAHFLIGEGKEILFIAVKEHCADDADIFDFVEKSSSIKGKNVKKIFISLERFSSTARLTAKNNKLIAWDLHELDDLLRMYHKPIITCERRITDAITSENFSNC
ncbi:MAG: hypothetical protein WCI77_10520 [Candidatus Omnitrophota bacterium]